MIISENFEQGSEEWRDARKGRATASEFKNILTPTGRASKSAVGYMRKLARECVCDDPHIFMGNKHTEWGNATEPEAREWFRRNVIPYVHEVGFVSRADGAPVGCSPDGLIKDPITGQWLGGLEIKCPQVDTHVGYVLDGVLPDAYALQVHGSMAVTGLPFWYFMSYFPGLNPLVIKVERDTFTNQVSNALDSFIIDYAKEREKVLEAIVPEEETATHESEDSVI